MEENANIVMEAGYCQLFLEPLLLSLLGLEFVHAPFAKKDPLQSTKVIRRNHQIKTQPAVNCPIVEPLAVNILSAEGRGGI